MLLYASGDDHVAVLLNLLIRQYYNDRFSNIESSYIYSRKFYLVLMGLFFLDTDELNF